MQTNTRDLGFVNFNGQEMNFVNYNGITVYEAWKKLIESGVPPLTLLKCKQANLVNYKIYGQSISNKLPSEYQEIEYLEANGTQYIDMKYSYKINDEINIQFMKTGDTGAIQGIFGNGNINTYTGTVLYVNGTNVLTVTIGGTLGNEFYKYDAEPIEINKIYNVKFNQRDVYLNNEKIITVSNALKDGTQEDFSLFRRWGTNGMYGRIYNFNIIRNNLLIYNLIPCYRKSDNVAGMYDLVNEVFYTNAGTGTFLKGSNVSPIPTLNTPVRFESVGDKTSNLFDISKAENGTILTVGGTDYSQTNRARTDYIYLKAGNYCLSTVGTNKDITFGGYCHKYSSKDNTTWLGTVEINATVSTGTRNYRTFTLDEDCYCRFVMLPITGSSITNLSIDNLPNYKPQIETGDIPTEYNQKGYRIPIKVNDTITNIYLNEPLRKIGNYADYIDFEKGKVVRRIYNEYLTTVYGKSSLTGTYTIFLSEVSKKPHIEGGNLGANSGYAISNKFKLFDRSYGLMVTYANVIQSYVTMAGGNRVAYTFDDSSITTVEQAQEKIGDGFDVYYVLDQEIEEDIDLPNIAIQKGTNIIEIDTSVQPSNMEVKYLGKKQTAY